MNAIAFVVVIFFADGSIFTSKLPFSEESDCLVAASITENRLRVQAALHPEKFKQVALVTCEPIHPRRDRDSN